MKHIGPNFVRQTNVLRTYILQISNIETTKSVESLHPSWSVSSSLVLCMCVLYVQHYNLDKHFTLPHHTNCKRVMRITVHCIWRFSCMYTSCTVSRYRKSCTWRILCSREYICWETQHQPFSPRLRRCTDTVKLTVTLQHHTLQHLTLPACSAVCQHCTTLPSTSVGTVDP